MIAPLILLAALVGVGTVLYIHHRMTTPDAAPDADPQPQGDPQPDTDREGDGGECCGMHVTCERDSLLAAVSDTVDYYDDEELDRFRGRAPMDYNDEETEEFRDVLLTLLPDDIAGWGRSLQLRGIELPVPVREELLLIVSEERMKRR